MVRRLPAGPDRRGNRASAEIPRGWCFRRGHCPRLCFGGTIALLVPNLPLAQGSAGAPRAANAWTKIWRTQAARLEPYRAARGARAGSARDFGARGLRIIQRSGVLRTGRYGAYAFSI